MLYFLYAAAFIVFIITIYSEVKKQLHMAQLEGYKPRQYLAWQLHNFDMVYLKRNTIFLLYASIVILFYSLLYKNDAQMVSFVYFIVYALAAAYAVYYDKKNVKKAKKPLVFTSRVKRLMAICLVLTAILAVLGFRLSSFPVFTAVLSLIRLFMPLIMLISVALIYPVEMLIQYRYFREAQLKIRKMKNLKVIGITGSFGKTSTKYFVKTILSEKYNTLMTPESYNTPMGITRVIREQLNDQHEVFVCEMGARHVGDIKTLCRLAGPSIGILTSIGKQHLETFKTIDNVAKTKYELIESLPENGVSVFNGDNEYCFKLAQKTKSKSYVYGIENVTDRTYIYAREIVNTKGGLTFRVIGKNGIDMICRTSLLGRHNVSNILAAICVALELGLSPEEIKSGISKIKPVPHRLQLLDTNNGVTVIDDAFNSNPAGAAEALETIKEIEGNKKIIITPGMVELGSVEYEENKKLGNKIAECCDYAVLVGIKKTKPIQDGLIEKGFPYEKMFVVSNLDEATAKLADIVRPGDVVLFENDLPDNYSEE